MTTGTCVRVCIVFCVLSGCGAEPGTEASQDASTVRGDDASTPSDGGTPSDAGRHEAPIDGGMPDEPDAHVDVDASIAPPACTPSSGTTEIGPDVVRDDATCLMWEAHPGFVGGGNWEPAKAYCGALTAGGFDDWRMPTVTELASLPLSAIPWIGRLGTAPRYVPSGATDLGNFHYCGITHWDTAGALGCGWVGPGNSDGTICVRGTAAVATPLPSGCDCQEGRSGFVARSE
ncbi:DUF1566 domain-containing protein [Sandaracinus amylolyticus]|uniref:Lcl C-terminal domain-containing protein n=1 Tax=Sandaracinus amylolyticus TaxID=927083 RepID=UPI001F1C3D47|nr:DUF1566 domain-containing protein [Sandaracinus amylolyticus]UJR78173.1 Hypothetical protein I5071_2000 [Sandaracinus amylolyticus]